MKVGRNDPCPCGSGKKHKKCCLAGNERKGALKRGGITITRRDFISGPYKQCPNQSCLSEDTFGVFINIEGSRSYMRECIKCGYRKSYALPQIKKKILYLDQFVISNLVKLLDKSHPSHRRVKSDPFWETLFVKLETALKSQAIVCPDSFYHKDESLLASRMDFKLMRRLYEHFSSGKTLYPSIIVEKNQITHHFEAWLEGRKAEFNFDPQEIAFDKDLHSWSIGLRISVGGGPYPGQIENLQKINAITEEQLKAVWERWQNEKNVNFVDRVREETAGLGRGLIIAVKQFAERRAYAMRRIAAGENYEMDLGDFLPPIANDILESLMRIARSKGLSEQQVAETILRYFNDIDALLEIPYVRITSVMFAGLAHRAASGQKKPPRSTADIQFIASYLPYCDALFVDKESASLLKEFPRGAPEYLRLKEFPAKIFSLNTKEEFLDYLDELVAAIPADQIEILKDMSGKDYNKPYWDILEDEKIRLSKEDER